MLTPHDRGPVGGSQNAYAVSRQSSHFINAGGSTDPLQCDMLTAVPTRENVGIAPTIERLTISRYFAGVDYQ